MNQQHDVFISHASEDKESIARPLAEFLQQFSLDVWYDEDVLEIGDSLSESIDTGLASSRFGVVILSQTFFDKPWARRELRGLVAKETAKNKKVILPIWHGVNVDVVREVSPTLADLYALSTDRESVEVIGLKIIRVVCPDIFKNIQRWVLWNKKIQQAKSVLTNLGDLKPSSRRHETLPNELLIRVRLIHQILGDVVEQTLDEIVDLFCRDLRPKQEIEVWERIAVVYQEVQGKFSLSLEEKCTLFKTLLGLSMGHQEYIEKAIDDNSKLNTAILEVWSKPISKPSKEVSEQMIIDSAAEKVSKFNQSEEPRHHEVHTADKGSPAARKKIMVKSLLSISCDPTANSSLSDLQKSANKASFGVEFPKDYGIVIGCPFSLQSSQSRVQGGLVSRHPIPDQMKPYSEMHCEEELSLHTDGSVSLTYAYTFDGDTEPNFALELYIKQLVYALHFYERMSAATNVEAETATIRTEVLIPDGAFLFDQHGLVDTEMQPAYYVGNGAATKEILVGMSGSAFQEDTADLTKRLSNGVLDSFEFDRGRAGKGIPGLESEVIEHVVSVIQSHIKG